MTAEATRTDDVRAREALIQETLRQEGRANLPFDSVVTRGEKDLPLEDPMTIREIKTAGYVYIWDTETYEKLPVLWYMLPSKLRQRNPKTGAYRFTPIDPKKMPYRGTVKCLLHKDNERRAEWDKFGFRACNKDNITNQHQLIQHMRLKHPQEWALIEEEKKEKERKEDRELQRAILGRIVPSEEIKPPIEITAPKVVEKSDMEKDELYRKRVENMAKAREAKAQK